MYGRGVFVSDTQYYVGHGRDSTMSTHEPFAPAYATPGRPRYICLYNPRTGEIALAVYESARHDEYVTRGWKLAQPVTKDSLINSNWWANIHYHGAGMCHKTVGPRGGVKVYRVTVRRNGAMQTWKARPNDFRQPCQIGFKGHIHITHENAHEYHLSSDCPLKD